MYDKTERKIQYYGFRMLSLWFIRCVMQQLNTKKNPAPGRIFKQIMLTGKRPGGQKTDKQLETFPHLIPGAAYRRCK